VRSALGVEATARRLCGRCFLSGRDVVAALDVARLRAVGVRGVLVRTLLPAAIQPIAA
jgi:hypothetical protein